MHVCAQLLEIALTLAKKRKRQNFSVFVGVAFQIFASLAVLLGDMIQDCRTDRLAVLECSVALCKNFTPLATLLRVLLLPALIVFGMLIVALLWIHSNSRLASR